MECVDLSDTHRYDDIIELPHHVSTRHYPMPMIDRAAQFSPFAALSGYGDAIAETARPTDARRELDEETQAQLNERIALLAQVAPQRPIVQVTWFQPDAYKEGGTYLNRETEVRRVDLTQGILQFADHEEVSLQDIVALESNLFRCHTTDTEEI